MKYLVFATTFTITFVVMTALFNKSEPTVIIKQSTPVINNYYQHRI